MFMKKFLATAALLAGAAVCLTGTAQAVPVYDVANDFSATSNPNGVWSYGYETTLGGTLHLYDRNSIVVPDLDFWGSSVVQSSGVPANWHNPTGSAIPFITVIAPAGAAAFHPGSGGEYSVYRFTAPSAGIYDLGVTFTGLDVVGTTTDVHVLQGSTSLFSGNINGYGSTTNYTGSLSLAANDIVDFAVGWGSNNNYAYDSTGIAATLRTAGGGGPAVPEPASLALLGIGLAGLVAARRRKAA